MMNRKQLEEFLPEGYVLISPEEGRKTTPLHLKCPVGHDWTTARIGNIDKGIRCKECGRLRKKELRAYSQEQAAAKLKSKGWVLKSRYRSGAGNKIDVVCLAGKHFRNATYANLIGASCSKCRAEGGGIEKLRTRLADKGAFLVSIDDPDQVSTTKVIYICKNDHVVHVSYKTIMDKPGGCRLCSGLAKLDIPSIKARLRKGFRYVSGKYENIHSSLMFQCPSGHVYETTWNKHQVGIGCNHSDCWVNAPLTKKDIRDRAEERNVQYVGGVYKTVDSMLQWKCPNPDHPVFNKSMRGFHHAKIWPCPICAVSYTRSQGEIEVADYVASLGVETVTNDTDLIGVDIDIFVPSKRFGIEFCGLYYHSEKFRDRDHHYKKYLAAKAHGYRVFFLYEDEWKDRKDRVKDYIRNKLVDDLDVIKADDCHITELTAQEYRPFIQDNHIQGCSNPAKRLAYGLNHPIHGLVYVLTSQKNRWGKTNNIQEVDRFVSKSDLRVVGGATKLFRHLISELKKRGISEIRTYSDLRYSWGNLYKQMGFKKADKGTSYKEDYCWVKNFHRKSKQAMRLKPEEKVLGLTLVKLRQDEGWLRLFGCGKDTWVYKIKSDINDREYCENNKITITECEDSVVLQYLDFKVQKPTLDEAIKVIRNYIELLPR